MAYYVCSDLHGYSLEKFKKFLYQVGVSQNDCLYVLGDVIDRGTDGIKILKWLMSEPNTHFILGNHEQMMLDCDFLFDAGSEFTVHELKGSQRMRYRVWISNYGQHTLDVLSTMHDKEIQYILSFLRESPLFKTLNVNGRRFVLTHSGLGNFKNGKSLSDYSIDDLLWNRPNPNQMYFDDVMVVFGHTPTFYYGKEYEGKAIATATWIDIDVGAGYGFCPMLLRLDDLQEFYCTE